MNDSPARLTLSPEGRFARFDRIEWWDQSLLRQARVLVIGAGALGNEVIKNLSLLGVGHLAVADMDRVERSNLTRSVLFRESDEGLPKADCAVRAARQLYPDIQAEALVGNVLADVGLGYFLRAQVVVGCLDNREARVYVNAACARLGRPWIDGGIEVLNGIVRGFAPPGTACYECTMSHVDWDLINQRRSCSMLARRALAQRGTPTTPTTASVIGGMQAQEVVKALHGLEVLAGQGFVFEGAGHSSYRVNYRINPDCTWHSPPAPVACREDMGQETPLREVWAWASEQLGGLDALDLARELVEELACPSCGRRERVLQAADKIREDQVLCSGCRTECAPRFVHALHPNSDLLELTVGQLGLPPWDIIWARHGERVLGIEFAGDRPPFGQEAR
jgi:molybdopterin/thiamine biosynthesis adenylyltransferase